MMSGQAGFKINSKFAEKYDKYRQKEELQKLKDRFGDEEEHGSDTSDSSSDDDSEVELDPKLERDFYRTLSLLKKKDPKIYQEDATFFAGEGTGSNSDDEEPSTSKAAVKPMYLRDYERKVILEKGGKYEDEDDSENEEASRLMHERAASPSYMQEQRDIKASFRKFMQDSDEGSDDDDGMLLKRRVKTQEEKDHEEADYVEWLKGQADLEGKEEVQDMSYLKEYWNDPQLDEKECFLRDYVLNKGYLDADDEDRIPTYEELVQDDVEDSEEEGDSFLKKQEDFERKYNFRFEEPDSIKVKTYPRNIATSVRTKDERRKRKREEIKDRKTKEKEQKREQLKQLKNLKRGEIMEKLKQLQEVTGNEELAFSQHDLEGEFNPQQHDQLMEKFFGDEYYGLDEDEKPQFDDEELEDGHWNWDTWTGEGDEGAGEEEEEEEYGDEKPENYEPTCEDPDFIMDADYDPSQQPAKKKKKKKEREEKKKQQKLSKDDLLMGKKRKVSHFAEVISKDKPVFDPKDKSFEQYLDEYYRLDYEDIIDDQPCRFRYREVVANDFGLSTDEILTADEKELNRWCSLKKTCMYRPEKDELCDVKNYQVKAQDLRKKKQVFVSLYSEEEKEEAKGKVGKKRRDRMKNAEQRQKVVEEEGEEEEEAGCSHTVADTTEGSILKALAEMKAEEEEEEEEFLVPKKKKPNQQEHKEVAGAEAAGEDATKPKVDKQNWPRKKPRHPGGRLLSRSFKVKLGGREFSRQRLRAYGLNPKKVHYRELYRQKRIQQEKRQNKQKTPKSE